MGKELNVIEARNLIKTDTNLQLIDIRSQAEFEKVSIDGFINIPVNDLTRLIPELDPKKKTLILSHKGDSSYNAQKLLEACQLDAYVIRGGIDVWAQVIDKSLIRY